jgi:phospholipid/cholesterol/gamma-HCH transport system substrate-binding protein
MARLSTEAKLGLFVLLGIALLIYMSLQVGEWRIIGGGGYEIKATFDSVAGLKKDVPVEIAGVEVGRVAEIRLKDHKAEVVMRIKKDVRIPIDSTAVIQTKGVLGEKYVEIVPPAETAASEGGAAGGGEQSRTVAGGTLPPGGEIKHTRPAADVDRLLRTIGEVGDNIKRITDTLSKTIGGPKGEHDIREIVENIRDMTANLNRAVAENRGQFHEMVQNFAALSQDLREISAENRGRIKETLGDLQAAAGQLEHTMASVDRLTQSIEQGKGTVGKLMTDPKIADDLQNTMASLRDITQKVNDGKGTLGKLINDETTVTSLNKTLEGFGRYQQKFEDFKTYLGFRGEYLTRQGSGKGYMSLQIQPKRDKFYLIEILRDPGFTQKNQQLQTTTVNGVTTQTNVQPAEKDRIKFSLEIGKRFYDLVVRGGVIESAAGAAADYYLFNDKLRFSVEAFDFGRSGGAHYKAYANYNFLKYFFITTGYDDIGVSSRRSPIVGGGLNFLDDDIKYLITGAPVSVSTK